MEIGDDDGGSSDGGEDVYKRRVEPMLVSLSDSYSKNNRILGSVVTTTKDKVQ